MPFKSSTENLVLPLLVENGCNRISETQLEIAFEIQILAMDVKSNMREIIGDINRKKHLKLSELKQLQARISRVEKELQILDPDLQKIQDEKMVLSTKSAEGKSALESMETKRDEEMDQHSKALFQVDAIENAEKQLNQSFHEKDIKIKDMSGLRLGQFNESLRLAIQVEKGNLEGTVQDIQEDLINVQNTLQTMKETVDNERNDSEFSETVLDFSDKEFESVETAISALQAKELNIEAKMEKINNRIMKLSK